MPTIPNVLDTLPESSLKGIVPPSGPVITTLADDAPLAFHDIVYTVLLIVPELGVKLILGAGITGGGGGGELTVTDADALPPLVSIVALHVPTMPNVLDVDPLASVVLYVGPSGEFNVTVLDPAPASSHDSV